MIQGKTETITIVAGTDLDTEAQQYLIVNIGGTIAATSTAAIGVNEIRPKTGDHMTVAWMGHMKARAGAAVLAGAMVKVINGFLITAASNEGDLVIGKSLVAANSGDMINLIGNFANVGAP